MRLSTYRRLGVVFVLFLGLTGLLVLHGVDHSPDPELGVYPGNTHVATEPSTYIGQYVSVRGQVISTNPVVIIAESGDEPMRLEITSIQTPVRPGDRLRVFGILRGARRVDAAEVLIIPDSGYWYARVVSLIAGFWVLGRSVKHWRFDFKVVAFVPRLHPPNGWVPKERGR